MGSGWEVDSEEMIHEDSCQCKSGKILTYEKQWSSTKGLYRVKTEKSYVVSCNNPDCPSNKLNF